MALIWVQSGYFNPGAIGDNSSHMPKILILLIGATLELAHLFEFGILYLLIVLAFMSFGELTKREEFIAAIISFLYGIGDEIHQHFVPFRSASIEDLIKNTIGILIFWWMIRRLYVEKKNTKLARFLRKIVPVHGEK
jgi:polysaccharide biosynthesis protein VpsQ